MKHLHAVFEYQLWSKFRLGGDLLYAIHFQRNGFDIQVFPPKQDEPENAKSAQKIKIIMRKQIDSMPDEISPKICGFEEYSKIILQSVFDLIRLHTRQFLSGNPKVNAINQYSVKITDDNGQLLHGTNYVFVGRRRKDEHEFALDEKRWLKVSEYLKNDLSPELYFWFLLDAKYYAFIGKVSESILLISAAIEQFTVENFDCDKQDDPKTRKSNYADFFSDLICSSTQKSLKSDRKDYYHTLRFLFETRNNIAHGRGCYFTISPQSRRPVERIFGPAIIESDDRVEVDKIMGGTLTDTVFEILCWILD